MNFTVHIHAHVGIDDLTALLAALENVEHAQVDIGVSNPMDLPPINPLAYAYACEHCDYETDDNLMLNAHMQREHDIPSQAVLDEIARINGANHPTNWELGPVMATADEVNEVHERVDVLAVNVDKLSGAVATRASHVDVNDVHTRVDALDTRLTDYESRFRGLLADFEGMCSQMTDHRLTMLSDYIHGDDGLSAHFEELRQRLVALEVIES